MPIMLRAFPKQHGSRKVRAQTILFLTLLSVPFSFGQKTKFSQENAAAILRTLAVEIGPRPMGSPAEQRALAFAVEKFKEYGCDSAYILPMTVAEGVNTTSGVAVGVKKGTSGRIIVIGGHSDTAGPDVPGANDDGSGTACVIELARVLAEQQHRSTIYFCCWGGEEQGLRGSTYFVNTFPLLDSVALMLQIDMADGAGELQADPDGTTASAPAWLVEAAFRTASNDLKRTDLVYPTTAATWNLTTGGTTGSDHQAFLDKGIPAIDFTSDVNYPIHTPQDSWENFTPAGLQRSGDLVLALVEKFDGGVPSRSTERYQLLQFGSQLLFVRYEILWAFIAMAAGVAAVAFVIARRKRLVRDASTRIRWSRVKFFCAALVIQACVWNSETLVGLLGGYRFPWVNNMAGFTILGLLCGLSGVWIVLQAVHRYRLSDDAYVFVRSSLVSLFILTVLGSYATPEMGAMLAALLLLLSIAFLVRQPFAKLLLFLVACVLFYKLLFFSELELLQRLIAQNHLAMTWQKVLLNLAYVVFFAVLSLPFMHGFAAIYRGSGVDLLGLKKFRTMKGLIATLAAATLVTFYLLRQPVYGRLWYNDVRVEQRYALGAETSSVEIRGSEYLRGLRGSIGGRDTLLTGRTNVAPVVVPAGTTVSWCAVAAADSVLPRATDTLRQLERTIFLRSRFRPYRVEAQFESGEPFEVASPWAHGAKTPDPTVRETDRRKRFVWFAYPDTMLLIPVTFTLHDTQRVAQEIRVVFDSLAYPVRLQREFTNVSYRTVVTARDTFGVGAVRRHRTPERP